MTTIQQFHQSRFVQPLKRATFAVGLLTLLLGNVPVAFADSSAAEALRAKYTQLAPKLANNVFKRPLVMTSVESSGALKGDIYAVTDHSFSQVSSALDGPSHWCDVLILHLNTKYCRALNGVAGTTLQVSVGKKTEEPLEDAYRVNFAYRQGQTTADYFDARMDAKKGPLGTSDYQIVLEAVALPANKTFLHLTYSYAYGFASKVAMQGYLATAGSAKVGFTSVGREGDGKSSLVGGMRGVIERNTMRYYLAIDSYLDTQSLPTAEQTERRLQRWFDATEAYPLQLHEVERGAYLTMKHAEIARQQTAQ